MYKENDLISSRDKKYTGEGMEMKERIQRVKDYLRGFDQWNRLLAIFLLVTIVGISGFAVYQNGFSYEVVLNGDTLGVVKEVHTAENALKEVEKEILEQYGEEAYFQKEMTFEKVRANEEQFLVQQEIKERLFQSVEIYKPAAIILVDGEERLVLDNQKEAEEILEKIKKPYTNTQKDDTKNVEVLEVSFEQEVEILSKDVKVDNILSKEQAVKKIKQDTEKIQTYQIAKGDSAWNISRAFDMGIRTLEDANPEKDIEKLKPGETINLSIKEAFIDVVTREKQVETEKMKVKVKEQKDSSLYIGEEKVKQEGQKGKKEITKEVTYINGVKKEEEVIDEVTLEEPIDKIVLVGTKQRPVVRVTSRNSNRSESKSKSKSPAPTYNGGIGSSIVATSKHYIGTPYVSGGASPSGFDCSGFTQYVYAQYGIYLPRTTGGQANVGGHVSRSNLQPGDLVTFPGHVGIYVGGNSFIHSPSPGKSVMISSLNSSYWSPRFRSGRRAY